MPSADERHDVGLHIEIAEALPVSGSDASSRQRQQVARCRLPAGHQRLARSDQVPDHFLEESDGRPRPQAADAGHPGREAEDIDRIDAPQTLEIAGNGAPSASGFRDTPMVKIVRSSTSSVTRVISRETSTTRPSGRRCHRRTRRSAESTMAGKNVDTVRGLNRGAIVRR